MAAVTLLASTVTSTNSTTLRSVAGTPAVGDLIVLVAMVVGGPLITTATDNNADGGGTYTRLGGSDALNFFIRDQLITNASSTTFTVNFDSNETGGALAVMKVTGMARVGANAARQYTTSGSGAGGTTPTTTLGSAALTGNALIGVVQNGANPAALTPRSSPAWTERLDSGFNTPVTGIEVMSINSGETGTSIAWGGTSGTSWGARVLELDTTQPGAIVPFNPTRHILPFLIR